MLVPYSKYQVVAWPFGFTVPVSVAVAGPTEVTGPVIAAGRGRRRTAGDGRDERDRCGENPDAEKPMLPPRVLRKQYPRV